MILIDGGKGQLSAASDALDDLDATPPMLLALAKKQEEIFVHAGPGRAKTLRLAKRDPALRLLMSVRDEAHRFAQHYHHILRRLATLPKDAPPRKRRKKKR